MELKIYKCMHCGNIIEVIEDHGVPVICCGEPMKQFKAGETDGAAEKHVPAVAVEGDVIRVCVGEVAHPMTEEHHIEMCIRDRYTPLFATARIVGWMAHRLEEVTTGGKIIRPAYKPLAKNAEYINLEDR